MIVRSRKDAAAALGVTPRQLGNWTHEPWFPAEGRRSGGWNVTAIAAARDQAGKKGSDVSEVAIRLRLAREAADVGIKEARAERERLALDRDRGAVIPRPAIELFAATLLTEIADWCEQVPDIVANSVPTKYRKAIRQRLREELDRRRRATRDRLEREAKHLDHAHSADD